MKVGYGSWGVAQADGRSARDGLTPGLIWLRRSACGRAGFVSEEDVGVTLGARLYFRLWGLHVDCMIFIRTPSWSNAQVPLRP